MKLRLLILSCFYIFFTVIGANVKAQDLESIILPWQDDGKWYVSDSLTNDKSLEYTFLRQNDMPEVWREQGWLRIYPSLISLSAKQLFDRFCVEIRPYYGSAKVTILERHDSFQTRFPFYLFTIESDRYGEYSEPRTAMYYLIKGDHYTFIAARISRTAKLSAKLKKSWKHFFGNTSIENIPLEQAWEKMGLIEP